MTAKELLQEWLKSEEYYNDSPATIRKIEEILQAMDFDYIETIFKEFPQNKPLYLDSDLWTMRSDDLEQVLVAQDCDETFGSFLKRCKESEGGE